MQWYFSHDVLIAGMRALLMPLARCPAPPAPSGVMSAARWRVAPGCWAAWSEPTPGPCGTLGCCGPWPGSGTRSVQGHHQGQDQSRGCHVSGPRVSGDAGAAHQWSGGQGHPGEWILPLVESPQQPQTIAQLLNPQLAGNSNHRGEMGSHTSLLDCLLPSLKLPWFTRARANVHPQESWHRHGLLSPPGYKIHRLGISGGCSVTPFHQVDTFNLSFEKWHQGSSNTLISNKISINICYIHMLMIGLLHNCSARTVFWFWIHEYLQKEIHQILDKNIKSEYCFQHHIHESLES